MHKLNRYIATVFTSPRKKPVRHLLLQLLLLMISSSVLWEPAQGAFIHGQRVVVWMLYYAVLNVLVYVNIYLLAKKLLLQSRVSAYVFSVLGLVAVFMLLIGILQSFLPEVSGEPSTPALIGVLSSVAAVGLLFAGTSALVMFRQWILSEQRRSELESLNLAAELQMLKNQINPHFLFNMLNNCYLLVKKQREEAARVIFRLEELLRYQMGGIDNEKVTLEEETRFLSDLLSLEKIRRDQFRFSIEDHSGGEAILLPPMLFIPFVENAIKHNSDSQNLSYVDVSFRRWEKGIVFSCINSKPGTEVLQKETGGLGLSNIRRRLELLFPDRHQLTIVDEKTTYAVTLKLEL